VEYRKALGVEHLPAPSTMQAHNKDISEAYFQRVIGLIALMIMNLQGSSSVNAVADSFPPICTAGGTLLSTVKVRGGSTSQEKHNSKCFQQ